MRQEIKKELSMYLNFIRSGYFFKIRNKLSEEVRKLERLGLLKTVSTGCFL
jgi:hypothetical protein